MRSGRRRDIQAQEDDFEEDNEELKRTALEFASKLTELEMENS